MYKQAKYYINSNSEFVIENYNLAGPFSNFLPGIAGLFGIPMWVFYVNRAQCISSFGVKSKEYPIMEFLPANRAYQLTSSQCFRTFIKIKDKKTHRFYEPFCAHQGNGPGSVKQSMFISSGELRLLESAPLVGLEIEVVYFTIPNESFPALARLVTFKNISRKTLKMDILDGTPLIVPYGVSTYFLNRLRRTVEAWMLVENLEKKVPFYRLKVDPKDISEVTFINEGNFYLALLNKYGGKTSHLPVFIDPEVIFGEINDFSYPMNFANNPKFNVPVTQIGQNKFPCAMSFASLKLKGGEGITIYSLLGNVASKDKLNSLLPSISKEEFFTKKREENKNIIKGLQETVFTASGEKRYNLYCEQTFLDNVLRGGNPVSYGNHSHPFYVYARKHGDLERDYNRFYLQPTYFSQGNGNYRDINQNRRNDVCFDPDVKDFNILYFYNLLQADGFNPLVLHGIRFRLKEKVSLKDILMGKIEERDIVKLKGLLSGIFTPGELFMDIEKLDIKLKSTWQDLLNETLKNCEIIYDAEHVEGFWIDHWTYNLDLVENFLSIYPERLKELLFDKIEFTFYDNIFCVKPRAEKCLLNGNNLVRQYHALIRDSKKEHLIKNRSFDPHMLRTHHGEGEIYKTTLIVKFLCIVANKLSSLDPFGIGIEMEADKPGWCDSMNGLPGLFGSSTPEVFELKRQVLFISGALKNLDLEDSYNINIPEELYDFLKKISSFIKTQPKISVKKRDLYFWDKSNSLKEKYREKVKLGFSGVESSFGLA
ncbi:MAG: cellobiose phosphorylase, partial [Candidatus Omnitrophica bacterium]|nr:cellobiose phosphorylase [Candidatus Omnitrophota bacterium]